MSSERSGEENPARIDEEQFRAWVACMRCGDFAAAWAISDTVLKSRAGTSPSLLPEHQQYFWDGSPLNGRPVTIRCQHGLGDTIQFIRYAPMVSAVASKLTVLAQPKLIPLLKTIVEIDSVLPLTQRAATGNDLEVELMELPHVFRTATNTIPNNVPYLRVAPGRFDRDQRSHVGLVWTAGQWNQRRSIPFIELSPLFELSGIVWCILQRDALSYGWQEGAGRIVGGDDALEDARTMLSLDLVISVDTMTAHLAGALGVPVWTLLPADADWRWMLGRDDTPWYPTMRLFRQQIAGDWAPVIECVAAELRNFDRGE